MWGDEEEEELWPLNMRLSRLCPVSALESIIFSYSIDPTLFDHLFAVAHCSKGTKYQ